MLAQAQAKIPLAFKHKTRLSYSAHFRVYLGLAYYLDIQDITALEYVLIFIEYLSHSGLKYPTIQNYMSSIRFHFAYFSMPVHVLTHLKVKLLLKAIVNNSPYNPRIKGVSSIDMLHGLVKGCDTIKHGVVYKSLFLLAFFGFLRMANLLPSSYKAALDSKALTRLDLHFHQQSVEVIIKRSKTMQKSDARHVISIPRLGKSPICPYAALRAMYLAIPAPGSEPVFLLTPTPLKPLLASKARQVLANLLNNMGCSPAHFTFHAFRRSGATFAFNNGVPFQKIRLHGQWKSDAIYAYLESTNASNLVSSTFKQLLQQ